MLQVAALARSLTTRISPAKIVNCARDKPPKVALVAVNGSTRRLLASHQEKPFGADFAGRNRISVYVSSQRLGQVLRKSLIVKMP